MRKNQVILPKQESYNNKGNYNGWKRRQHRTGFIMWCLQNFKFVAITSTILLVVGSFGITIAKYKIQGSIKDAKLKQALEQRDSNLLIDNGDGTKSSDLSQALQFKLEELAMDLQKDFSEAGVTTLYSDRLYDPKKTGGKVPTYEENPELFIKASYSYTTKLKGTIDLSTNILPSFKYFYDPSKIEVTVLGNSVYVNIPDSAFICEGNEEARGGSVAKDSFGATLSQVFNKKEEEESKAHDGLNNSVKIKLREAADKRLLDPVVIEDVREAAKTVLKDDLSKYMDTSHIIIKANGAHIRDELKDIENKK